MHLALRAWAIDLFPVFPNMPTASPCNPSRKFSRTCETEESSEITRVTVGRFPHAAVQTPIDRREKEDVQESFITEKKDIINAGAIAP